MHDQPEHLLRHVVYLVLLRRAASSTLFPYTTLFRSVAPTLVYHSFGSRTVRITLALGWASTSFAGAVASLRWRSEEHTSELQSRGHLVCRLLLEQKNKQRSKPGTREAHRRSTVTNIG